MTKYNDLSDYLNAIHKQEIYEKCESYFNYNKRKFDLSSNYIESPTISRLDSIIVTSVSCKDEPENYIIIEANVRLDIFIEGKAGYGKFKDYDEEIIYRYVVVKVKTKIEDILTNFEILDVSRIEDRYEYNKLSIYSKNFVPYMEDKNFDFYAENFLRVVYPEALNVPTKIDVNKILSKLDLKVKYDNLEGDKFAKIYFFKKDNMEENTIVVDRRKSFVEGDLCERNTIVHECIHYFYHRKYFYLKKVLDPSFDQYACDVIKNIYVNNKENEWIEWQANSLSPRVLMPRNTTELKFIELSRKYDQIKSKVLKCEKILSDISDFFGVSKLLAKIRLVQLNHKEFIHIYDEVDGKQLSYIVNDENGFLNVDYRISFLELVGLTYFNKKLLGAMVNQRILFIDNFLVLNDEKYVIKKNGKYVIREECLSSINKDFVKFKTSWKNNDKEASKDYSLYYLCRTKKGKVIQKSLSNCEGNSTLIDKSKYEAFIEEDKEETEMIKHMMGNFNEAFKYVYDKMEISSFNYLESLTKINHKTLSDYYYGNIERPNYRKVLAIIAGMNLSYRVARQLLKTIVTNLEESTNPIDHLYHVLMMCESEKGIDEWNKIILEAGFKEEDKL